MLFPIFSGQEPGQELAEFSASGSYKAEIKVLARTLISSEAQLGNVSLPKLKGSLTVFSEYLKAYWSQDLSFLLTVCGDCPVSW